jgi:hypothetical protein
MTAHPGPRKTAPAWSLRRVAPVSYHIVVRGRLSERHVEALDVVKALEPRPGETRMRAEVLDQAQLYGLLNRLRDLGLELLSVCRVAASPAATRQGMLGDVAARARRHDRPVGAGSRSALTRVPSAGARIHPGEPGCG